MLLALCSYHQTHHFYSKRKETRQSLKERESTKRGARKKKEPDTVLGASLVANDGMGNEGAWAN